MALHNGFLAMGVREWMLEKAVSFEREWERKVIFWRNHEENDI